MNEMFMYRLGQKRGGGSGGGNSGGGEEWIGDGNTHLWITLPEGRTSPMLGVCPNGTVTVDWGDGSAPDTLTGTSTSTVQWTPNHAYGKAGDYVITLTVDGELGFCSNGSSSSVLRYSSEDDTRNYVYLSAVKKIEFGEHVTTIGNNAFRSCYGISYIVIPDGVTSIGNSAFFGCRKLSSISIPESVTNIGERAFQDCVSLSNIVIPESVISIGSWAFYGCYNLLSIVIPDGVTLIGERMFYSCMSLSNIILPASVTRISSSVFYFCYSMAVIDFTKHSTVPALSTTDAFSKIPADCIFKIPASLYDEWIAATNWSAVAATNTFVGV